jgi:hypothetical protein
MYPFTHGQDVTLDDTYEMWIKSGHRCEFGCFVDAVLSLGFRIM